MPRRNLHQFDRSEYTLYMWKGAQQFNVSTLKTTNVNKIAKILENHKKKSAQCAHLAMNMCEMKIRAF